MVCIPRDRDPLPNKDMVMIEFLAWRYLVFKEYLHSCDLYLLSWDRMGFDQQITRMVASDPTFEDLIHPGSGTKRRTE